MAQPILPKNGRDLFVLISFRFKDWAKVLQVSDGIHTSRYGVKTKPTVKVATQTDMPGIAGHLADMVHVGSQGCEGNIITFIPHFPACLQERAKGDNTN